jgi:hypothetical protein
VFQGDVAITIGVRKYKQNGICRDWNDRCVEKFARIKGLKYPEHLKKVLGCMIGWMD